MTKRTKLNGWWRLWVVGAIVWTIIVASLATLMIPRTEMAPHSREFINALSKHLQERIVQDKPWEAYASTQKDDSPAKGGVAESRTFTWEEATQDATPVIGVVAEFPNGHVMKFRPGLSDEEINEVGRAYAAEAEKSRSRDLMQLVLLAGAVAAVPCISAALLGLGIAWIRRGFKNAGEASLDKHPSSD
ncbi:MAG: hypothetical protein ACK5V7_15000 [bacterium]|jgi:hypothetical protein